MIWSFDKRRAFIDASPKVRVRNDNGKTLRGALLSRHLPEDA